MSKLIIVKISHSEDLGFLVIACMDNHNYMFAILSLFSKKFENFFLMVRPEYGLKYNYNAYLNFMGISNNLTILSINLILRTSTSIKNRITNIFDIAISGKMSN